MDRLADTIFENLDISSLSQEECRDSLYYIDRLIEKDESPENFIKYQFLKLKIESRLAELKNDMDS